MARRNNKILVPEAREGLDQLKAQIQNSPDANQVKYEVASEQGVHLNKGYNGQLTSKDAGKIGGNIGGSMVKELVARAQSQMKNQK